jgi:hypothetical protein
MEYELIPKRRKDMIWDRCNTMETKVQILGIDMRQQYFNMGSGMNNEKVKFKFSGNGFDGF